MLLIAVVLVRARLAYVTVFLTQAVGGQARRKTAF